MKQCLPIHSQHTPSESYLFTQILYPVVPSWRDAEKPRGLCKAELENPYKCTQAKILLIFITHVLGEIR